MPFLEIAFGGHFGIADNSQNGDNGVNSSENHTAALCWPLHSPGWSLVV